jgi:predicted amidohydrolase YtcJ
VAITGGRRLAGTVRRLATIARPFGQVCLAGLGLCCLSCGTPADDTPASITLALVNGRIWTGDQGRPWVEALAVSNGRVAAVGTSDAIELLVGDAAVIDVRQRLVLPGFIDTHTHLLDHGAPTRTVNLATVRSRRQFVTSIATATTNSPANGWLRGHEWDQRMWGDTLPNRDWIDRVTPNHPVWLLQRDRQMGLANGLALEQAGVVPGTPGAHTAGDGPDGSELTGILTGAAMRQLESIVPPPATSARDRALDHALRAAAARGVTSVHHVGTWNDLDVFRRALDDGRLSLRVYAAVPILDWVRLDRAVGVRAFGGPDGRGDEWLRVGAVHLNLDGSLPARTAAFDAAYADTPVEPVGLAVDINVIRALVFAADDAGMQVMARAVGDRAIRAALDLYAQVVERHGRRDRRFRVELAQHVRPIDIARFSTGRVLASALPLSTIHEGRWIDQQLGPDRARTSFPFRTLLDAGTVVSFGSGWPDRGSPVDGIYAAVTRRTLDGLHPQGWVPNQRLTVVEALRAYTAAGAYAGFDEARTGTLTVGRLADFVIVDRDLLSVPSNDIPSVRVVMTVVGGDIVFDRLRQDGSRF